MPTVSSHIADAAFPDPDGSDPKQRQIGEDPKLSVRGNRSAAEGAVRRELNPQDDPVGTSVMFSGLPDSLGGITPGSLGLATRALEKLEYQGCKLVLQGSYLNEEFALSASAIPPNGHMSQRIMSMGVSCLPHVHSCVFSTLL